MPPGTEPDQRATDDAAPTADAPATSGLGDVVTRPVFGRPSPASAAPWKLRPAATAAGAAVRADGGDTPTLSLRVASLAGVRHRVAATGPEDAYAWHVTATGLVAAVADGVGSRPGAAAASAVAAEVAVDAMAAGSSPADAVVAASDAIADGEGFTTLVAACVDGAEVDLARVGDSTALVLHDGGWQELWADPDRAGAGTQAAAGGQADDSPSTTATAAIPAAHPVVEVASCRLDVGDALVVVTDGVGDALRDGPTTVAPGLAAALATPPDPLELARVTDFSRQGVGDDRTLLAVWVRG